MKLKLEALNEKFPEIKQEVNKLLKEKFKISGVNISQINFSEEDHCPPGYEQVCKYYGKDPITHKPVIRCKCVRIIA
jgi:hypothetical protein